MTWNLKSPNQIQWNLFVWMVALSVVVNKIRWQGGAVGELGLQNYLEFAVFFVASFTLIVPHKSSVQLLFSAITLTELILRYPFLQNHEVILVLVALAIVLTSFSQVLSVAQKSRGVIAKGQEVLGFAMNAIRIAFVILYLGAGVSKWNSGFVSTSLDSCAYVLFDRGFGGYFSWLNWSGQIWWAIGVAAIETAIPLLLMFQKSRTAGLLVAVFFHFAVSAHPDVPGLGFSFVIYAALILFLPTSALSKYDPARWVSLVRGVRHVLQAALAIGLMVLGVWVFFLAEGRSQFLFFWVPISLLTLELLLLTAFAFARAPLPIRREPNSRRPSQTILAAIAVAIVAQPYVGLSTTPVMTMYSNLRTEAGVSNHFFIPERIWTTRQDDLLVIEDSTDPYLHSLMAEGFAISRHELSRLAANQVLQVASPLENETRWTSYAVPELNWVEAKLLGFRHVSYGTEKCQW